MGAHLGTFRPEQEIAITGGIKANGHIGIDDSPVLVYEPDNYDPNISNDFLLGTGLIERPIQFDRLGKRLITLGDRLIIIGYDHNHHKFPIRANAEAIVSASNQLENDHDFIAVGHSMGTVAMLLALNDTEFHRRTKALVQANPAMTGNHLLITPNDLLNVCFEGLVMTATHPDAFFNLIVSATGECIERPLVIGKQIYRLLTGKVHQRYTSLMGENPDLPIYVVFNKRDGLVPKRWGKSIAELGENVKVIVHNSRKGLAHSAINLDPDFAAALHAIAIKTELPDSFTPMLAA